MLKSAAIYYCITVLRREYFAANQPPVNSGKN